MFYLKKDKIKVNKKKKLFFDDFSFFFSQKFGELIKIMKNSEKKLKSFFIKQNLNSQKIFLKKKLLKKKIVSIKTF